jgi:hypothetical protein
MPSLDPSRLPLRYVQSEKGQPVAWLSARDLYADPMAVK